MYYFRRNLNWSPCGDPQWTKKIRDVCYQVLFLALGKFHPRSGREGPEGCTGTAVLFSSHSAILPTTLPRERNPVPVIQGAGWAPA